MPQANHATPTFLFYDIETTGRNACFDQAIQFAAIRTTLDFQEIERIELTIQLNQDVIPAPEALLVHKISIQQMQQGITELEATRIIHQWFNKPGTITLGYNTLGFDDEFMRFTFFRNLLTPYTHQHKSGCYRMDLYPITVLYALFKPEALNWPMRDGKISLKLEHINQDNQLTSGPAHQAIVDVNATVALAKKLASHAALWEYAIGYFDKKTELARLAKLPYSFSIGEQQHQEGLIIAGSIGAAKQFMAPAVYLGTHFHYKNQTLWLRLDDPALSEQSLATLTNGPIAIKKKIGEPPFILPPKPHYLSHLSKERLQLIQQNRAWLQQQSEWFKQFRQIQLNFTYPLVPEADHQAALYQTDFLTDREQAALAEFHHPNARSLDHLLDQLKNPRYRALAKRLFGHYFPGAWQSGDENPYAAYVASIWTGTTPPIDYRREAHLTPQQAYTRCQQLLQEHQDPTERSLLQGLSDYLSQVPIGS